MKKNKQKKDLSMILTRTVCYLNIVCLVTVITHAWGLKAGLLSCVLALASIIYSYMRIITLHKKRLENIVKKAELEVEKLHERR